MNRISRNSSRGVVALASDSQPATTSSQPTTANEPPQRGSTELEAAPPPEQLFEADVWREERFCVFTETEWRQQQEILQDEWDHKFRTEETEERERDLMARGMRKQPGRHEKVLGTAKRTRVQQFLATGASVGDCSLAKIRVGDLWQATRIPTAIEQPALVVAPTLAPSTAQPPPQPPTVQPPPLSPSRGKRAKPPPQPVPLSLSRGKRAQPSQPPPPQQQQQQQQQQQPPPTAQPPTGPTQAPASAPALTQAPASAPPAPAPVVAAVPKLPTGIVYRSKPHSSKCWEAKYRCSECRCHKRPFTFYCGVHATMQDAVAARAAFIDEHNVLLH